MRVRYFTKHTISIAIAFLLLFNLFPFQVAYGSTVETRYFTSTSETYKGIIVKKLLTTNTASFLSASIANGRRFGVRVWKTDTSETETEITSGSPVATVIHAGTSDDDGEYDATWACPETSLASTDRIVVKVYSSKQTPTSWSLIQTFITEQLGASKIDSATWTVHYCLYLSGTAVLFNYGSSTYPSRITNFVWTPAVTTAWHDVSLWTASLVTKTWSSGTSWTANLTARTWSSGTSWTENLQTRIWATTSTFYITTGENDGDVYGWNVSYAIAHDVAKYTFDYYDDDTVGQSKYGIYYSVYRTFLKFDTSAIPFGATITNASLGLYGDPLYDYSDADFIVNLQKWTDDTPITLDDFNEFDGINYDDGNYNSSNFIRGSYNMITISNFELITESGNSLICVRSSKDISSTPPTQIELLSFMSYEEGHSPKLIVTWEIVAGFNLLTRQYIAVATWLFDFGTRIWVDVITWTYNLVTMAWENISWIFYLGTSIWTDIATWGISSTTRIWNDIAIYTINLLTMAWHDLTWLFSLLPSLPAWNDIASWILHITAHSHAQDLAAAIILLFILVPALLIILVVRRRR